MVSKITIFEPHFDGAQFGPASMAGDESDVGPDEQSSANVDHGPEDPSKSRFVTLLQGAIVFVVLFVAMYVTLQRVLSREEAQPE